MNAKHLACALLVLVLASTYPVAARAGFDVGVTVGFAPPPLPVYVQPPCPSPGYIWTPGYWAYDDDDYYWVPGTWVLAPEFGLLWTPGYWSADDDYFVWHAGYWAPHVGFYGGINYGFGYFGAGFVGGYWRDHDFYYNRAVTNVNVTNVYNSTVYNNRFVNNSVAETRVSYHGGNGVHARPTRAEMAASREARRGLTPPQRRQVEGARTIPTLRASVNHGIPPVAATNRPGAFAGRGVVAARGAQGASSRPTAAAGNFSGRGSSARPASASAPIGATTRTVSDGRQFHSPPHPVTRSVDPVRTSPHIAAAQQASKTPQPISYSRNSVSAPRVAAHVPTGHTFNQPAIPSQYRSNPPPRVAAQAPMGHTFSRSAVPSQYRNNPPSRVAAQAPAGYTFNRLAAPAQYRGNPPPSARSFPAQAPDRRWAEAPTPHGNAAPGANFRPARDAQPAHVNDPAAQRNGRHS